MYPLEPMEKPVATSLGAPGKFAFFVHIFLAGSYSQKSFVSSSVAPLNPVPTYPFEPILKPTAALLLPPSKSAFWDQVFVAGSYSQKSFFEESPIKPIPT